MYKFPIGIVLDCLKKPFDEALVVAQRIGVTGLQVYSTTGDFAPENLDNAKKKEIIKKIADHGLTLSALCGDLGMGFGNPEKNPELIEKSKRIIDLAVELGTNVVTTHIGVVPADKNHERYKIMQEACGKLAEYADTLNAHFAIETGPEKSTVLKGFLDSLGSKGVAVNLDPANLVMVVNENPVEAVHNLKDYIVHTHAKDGNHLLDCVPEYIYGVTHPVPESHKGKRYYEEVPLGKGGVDFPSYLKALDEVGYKGYLTIEREAGQEPEDDIRGGVELLKGIIGY